MFPAVSTLQRPYYCTVLCVYVLQAVLRGSNHIHIFICQCYGSLTEVQQFENPSLITLKFCEMLLYIRWTSSQFQVFSVLLVQNMLNFVYRCKVVPHFSGDEVSKCFHVIFCFGKCGICNFQHLLLWAVIICCSFLFWHLFSKVLSIFIEYFNIFVTG